MHNPCPFCGRDLFHHQHDELCPNRSGNMNAVLILIVFVGLFVLGGLLQGLR